MTTVSTAEAESRIGELLRLAESGERIDIVRDGKRVASIQPAEGAAPAAVIRKGIMDLRDEMRAAGVNLSVREILELRDEGRK